MERNVPDDSTNKTFLSFFDLTKFLVLHAARNLRTRQQIDANPSSDLKLLNLNHGFCLGKTSQQVQHHGEYCDSCSNIAQQLLGETVLVRPPTTTSFLLWPYWPSESNRYDHMVSFLLQQHIRLYSVSYTVGRQEPWRFEDLKSCMSIILSSSLMHFQSVLAMRKESVSSWL